VHPGWQGGASKDSWARVSGRCALLVSTGTDDGMSRRNALICRVAMQQEIPMTKQPKNRGRLQSHLWGHRLMKRKGEATYQLTAGSVMVRAGKWYFSLPGGSSGSPSEWITEKLEGPFATREAALRALEAELKQGMARNREGLAAIQ